MSKVRIYTLAKDLGVDNAKMLEILDGLGVSYKSVSSTIEEDTVELIKQILDEESAGGAAATPDAAPVQASAPASAPSAPAQAESQQSAPQTQAAQATSSATATAEREPEAAAPADNGIPHHFHPPM